MGIKGLNKFLKSKCPEVFETISMETLSYKKIAVDAALYMCKYKIIYGDNNIKAYVDLIVSFREYNIHPIFVFDGQSPPEKAAEKQARQDARKKQQERIDKLEDDLRIWEEQGNISQDLKDIDAKDSASSELELEIPDKDKILAYIDKLKSNMFKITPYDVQNFKDVLDAFFIPWIQADGEGEILCAQLCKQGLVSAVLSADTDILAAKCPIMLSELKNKQFTIIFLENILSALNFSEDQWVDFCIMCGTDYNKNIPRIGPNGAFRIISTHGTLDNVPSIDLSILNFHKTRKLFEHNPYTEPIPFVKPPNKDLIFKCLLDNLLRISLDTIWDKIDNSNVTIV
jgi:5'-3' exonuclease